MLGSKLGMLKFLLMRNDKVWSRLSDTEKQIVLKNNDRHNNVRPDYADPLLYQRGRSYDVVSESPDIVQKKLASFLSENHPISVLEIGPGSGHLTRIIVSRESVRLYTGLDINNAFLEYLRPRLSIVKNTKAEFEFNLINADVNEVDFGGQRFNAIVFLSSIHHIPDRVALFKKLQGILHPGGTIFIYEPAHYIPRILYLLGKFHRVYGKKEFWSNLKNYGTHHFCTLEEFESVMGGAYELEIQSAYFYRINFPFPRLVKKAIVRLLSLFGISPLPDGTYETPSRKSLLRFFSDRMIIVFRKGTQQA
jgi:ubiquinone/menaquinone biosynthesis C-methylase UbiE